jgi:probable HAF family extracellular repeat protein
MQDLGTLDGRNSAAQSINAAGQIVGFSDMSSPGVTHAVLWTGSNQIQDLGRRKECDRKRDQRYGSGCGLVVGSVRMTSSARDKLPPLSKLFRLIWKRHTYPEE